MRYLALLLLLAAPAALAAPDTRTQYLSHTSATRLYVVAGRKVLEIFNTGPNTIWCSLTEATAVEDEGRPLAPGEGWSLTAGSGVPAVWCIAETADQSSMTGGTVVTQIP